MSSRELYGTVCLRSLPGVGIGSFKVIVANIAGAVHDPFDAHGLVRFECHV